MIYVKLLEFKKSLETQQCYQENTHGKRTQDAIIQLRYQRIQFLISFKLNENYIYINEQQNLRSGNEIFNYNIIFLSDIDNMQQMQLETPSKLDNLLMTAEFLFKAVTAKKIIKIICDHQFKFQPQLNILIYILIYQYLIFLSFT